MQVDLKSEDLITIQEQIEAPTSYITSEQLRQEIFNREGSKQITMMIDE